MRAGLAIALGPWAQRSQWPVLHAPPYWGEGLRDWTARHVGPLGRAHGRLGQRLCSTSPSGLPAQAFSFLMSES